MTSTEESAQPTRGIIIVSSSALLGMCGKIHSALEAEDALERGHYFDMLRFLAHNGFEIVIPEIVSVETGHILQDGADIDDAFAQRRRDNGLFVHSSGLKEFLKEVARNGIPGIQIVSPDSASPSAGYMEKLQRILHPPVLPGTSKRARHDRIADLIRAGIMGLQKEWRGKKLPSDDEIVYMVRHDYARSRQAAPVFVFSDDNNIRGQLREVPDISFLTGRGLIYAVVDTGLQRQAGFSASASAPQLSEDMWKANANKLGEREHVIRDEPEYLRILRGNSFYQALSRLAADIRSRMEAEPAETPRMAEESMSPEMRRFRDREAKTRALQQDTSSKKGK